MHENNKLPSYLQPVLLASIDAQASLSLDTIPMRMNAQTRTFGVVRCVFAHPKAWDIIAKGSDPRFRVLNYILFCRLTEPNQVMVYSRTLCYYSAAII